MQLSEQLKAQGWRALNEAPEGEQIELLVLTESGERVTEIGRFDEVEGGFYTHGELWPVRLDPIAWRPIRPIDWKPIMHVSGSTVAVLVILLMIYFMTTP